ncbi:LPS export ABC transporter periplasmic protein LptC [Synechococcus sp. MIT S9452]|uniref:LPS export ABC transporter periplasmic protein LptC n=1 Tax=Synechococcus sp. MIT S9452 TaxID=3082546 RepID=UPI0039A57ADE
MLASCSSGSIENEKQRPFVFNQLVLQQNSKDGKPVWQLKSPSSKYRIEDQLTVIKDPVGTFFKDGQATHRLVAPEALVILDGKQIELIKGVTMTALDDSGHVLKSQKATWRPEDELLFLEGNPVARNNNQQINADSSTYSAADNTLTLSGNVVLQSWQNGINTRSDPETTIYSPFVQWNTESGDLIAKGPLSGYQKAEGGRIRILTAPSANGNSKQEWLDFNKPVRIQESQDNIDIRGGPIRWWYNIGRLSSSQPVSGTFKDLFASGNGLDISTDKKSIMIKNNCELIQPAEKLTANSCFWNWETGRVNAKGSVVVTREELNQRTTAEILNGQATKDGRVVFASPDSQVKTQLQLKNQNQDSGPTNSKAPPVQF